MQWLRNTSDRDERHCRIVINWVQLNYEIIIIKIKWTLIEIRWIWIERRWIRIEIRLIYLSKALAAWWIPCTRPSWMRAVFKTSWRAVFTSMGPPLKTGAEAISLQNKNTINQAGNNNECIKLRLCIYVRITRHSSSCFYLGSIRWGSLLNVIISNRSLSKYSVYIFDEIQN